MPVYPKLLFRGIPLPGIQWAEWNGPDGMQSGDGEMGYEAGNQLTITYMVNWQDWDTAIRLLLGVNTVESNPFRVGEHRLSRTPPAQHPRNYWLSATRCSVKPVRWIGTELDAPSAGTTSTYQYAFITTLFQQLKYRILGDGELDSIFPPGAFNGYRQEMNRFTEFYPQIGIESIVREGGGSTPPFKWCEGPLSGNAFTSPAPQALNKGDFIVTQRRVPLLGGVLARIASYQQATVLDPLAGTINAAVFLNHPAQTLRYNGYRINPVECPINNSFMNLPQDQGYPSLVCDLEHSFSYWDPPPFAATRGHNLAPIPQDTTGRWAAVSPSGTLPDTTHAGIYIVKDWSPFMSVPG